jgi:uncharacterized protein (TIGR02147 family)
MEKPALSTYTNFRDYLKDVFEYRRKQSEGHLRPYSYSDFSAAADIRSPNYLKLIIQGERNMSLDMCKKFGRALKFDKAEQAEFEALVFYGQEKDSLQRNKYLKQLSEIRSQNALDDGSIDAETWEKVPGWLAWVLYALIDQENVIFRPDVLKKILRNQVTEKQISEALAKLVSSGDIEIIDGRARKKNMMLSGSEKIPIALIRKLQAELIYLGLESLYKDQPTEREISGFTMAMTEDEYKWVRHELRKVRKELQSKLMMAREKSPGQKVYQVNVQLFPLSIEAGEAALDGPTKKRSESASTGNKDI